MQSKMLDMLVELSPEEQASLAAALANEQQHAQQPLNPICGEVGACTTHGQHQSMRITPPAHAEPFTHSALPLVGSGGDA